MSARRLVPLSGIAFVALVVVAIVGIGGSTPGTDASAAELASFYDDNAIRQGIGTFVLAASVPFLVLFGVSLATTLGARTAWGHVLFAGTILVSGAVLLASTAHFALVLGVAAFVPVADFFGLLGTLLWIVVTSVFLSRRASVALRASAVDGNATVAVST